MPTYIHFCTAEECAHEWEDYYSVSQDPPKQCPKCLQETAKRGICGSNRGVVELTGQDLKDHIKSEANKIKREASQNERLYSNLLGESKYDSIVKKFDNAKKR